MFSVYYAECKSCRETILEHLADRILASGKVHEPCFDIECERVQCVEHRSAWNRWAESTRSMTKYAPTPAVDDDSEELLPF
jgi:hypothetical protein